MIWVYRWADMAAQVGFDELTSKVTSSHTPACLTAADEHTIVSPAHILRWWCEQWRASV